LSWRDLPNETILGCRTGDNTHHDCSIKTVSRYLRLSWDEVDGIKARGVARGLQRKGPVRARALCLDEKSVGQGHDYVTVVTKVTDETAFIDHIADGREEAALEPYWKTQPPEELEKIHCVSMDMWQPYMNSVAANLPAGKNAITHDPFHIVKNMNAAVDAVRRQEIALLPYAQGQELKGTRFMWLYGFENLPEKWNERLRALKDSQIKTARAWRLKETLRSLYQCESHVQATAFFHDWYRDAMRSKLDPVKKVAKCLKENICGVLNYFLFHVTNAYSEGINSTIQAIIKRANGYRNRERLKRDLYFHLGNLNMYPDVNL
jgi:transposase